MRDHIEFFRQFRRHFKTTGAVAPSSHVLAKAMTAPLADRVGPARVLEIGPGTGAVTRRIVSLLRPDDRLDLVELNERFAGMLERRFHTDPMWQSVAGQCRVHRVTLEEFASEGLYDFIISGLPLNNFSEAAVSEIFSAYFRLLADGGVLSYFEYMYVRPLRKLMAKEAERQRLADLERVMRGYLSPYRFQTDWVFFNVPPAWVQHLRNSHPDR